jgi:hypothetical protein
MLATSTTAAASTAGDPGKRERRGPIARAAVCIPCVPIGAAALRAAITAARAARAARVARQMAAAARQFAKEVRIRRRAISRAVAGARRVAPRGRRWVRRNWPKLPIDARRCLGGGAALLTTDLVDGGVVTEVEWDAFIAFHMPLADPVELFSNTQFDFSVEKDAIVAACLAGMVGGRVSG